MQVNSIQCIPPSLLQKVIVTENQYLSVSNFQDQSKSLLKQDFTSIQKEVFVWNTRIRSFVEEEKHEEALHLFGSMVEKNIRADCFTFPPIFKACSSLTAIREARQVHTRVLKTGQLVSNNVFVENSLLYAYANCGYLDYARTLFDKMSQRTLVSWNSLIAGYSKSPGYEIEAIWLYLSMLERGIVPDSFTFTVLIRACAKIIAINEGVQIHSHIIKLDFDQDALIQNSLIDMYVKFGLIEAAYQVFDRMTKRNVVMWNALISGALNMGHLDLAENLFSKMKNKNIVTWNSMISGHVQNGLCHEALFLFRKMQLEGMQPNAITIVGTLSACSVIGSLSLGKWAHLYCEKNGSDSNKFVSSALVNMYAKCGDIENSRRMFEKTKKKDIIAWDIMIEGLADHGLGGDALELFEEMRREGIEPDDITFIGILNACSHSGLLHEGLIVFNRMTNEFGIEPNLEHMTCLVDLFGRAGYLQKALEVIQGMKIAPDSVAWGAILSACKTYNNPFLAKFAMKQMDALNPLNAANYVLLSNMYAARKQWKDVTKVRTLMKLKELEKEPGCSSIELEGSVNEFLSGECNHPQKKQILAKLEELITKIKEVGYVPDTDKVLREVEEEEEKETAVVRHSEKLAVAFGLLNSSSGVPIRIVKNLRICGDCHSAIKLISKLESREIVVRDRNRFHHFKHGTCSCRDYW